MKLLKSSKGFTLIEILIAIGLLGALSAWMMNIFSQQTKNEKTTATNMDIDAIGQEIRNIIADGSSCAKTFSGKKPNQPTAVNEIQKVLSDSTVQRRYGIKQKKIGNSSVVVVGYDLKMDETYLVPEGQSVGETVLIVNYDRGSLVQGGQYKSFKIPLSVVLEKDGTISSCNSLASTTNLASICTSLGRSVDEANKKCSGPTIYLKGDTPVFQKTYGRCEGGSGTSEHTLGKWKAEGSGSARLTFSGLATDTDVSWKIYKNKDVIATETTSGIYKSIDIDILKGDVIKHTATLSGGLDEDCVSSGSLSVELDLLNML